MKLVQKISGGYGIILAIMIIVSVVAYNSLKSVEKTTGWVTHTYEVMEIANDVVAAMVDMETGLRGYLVTGQENYLEPYRAGEKVFDGLIAKGKNKTSDNPVAVQMWQDIYDLEKNWHDNYAEKMIEKRKVVAGGEVATRKFKEVSGRLLGKQLFDGIRAKLATLEKKAKNSTRVKNLITKTTLALVNMETGQRGFLLSGKEESLEPYISGKKDLIKQLRIMKGVIGGTSIKKSDINGVEKAVNAWQTKVADLEIEARRAMNKYPIKLEDIIEEMKKGEGKKSMDAIRALANKLITGEEKLLKVRNDDMSSTFAFAESFTIIGNLLAIILGVLIALYIYRNINTLLSGFDKGLMDFFKYLNKESSSASKLQEGDDEIGTMAKVVNQNIAKTQSLIQQDEALLNDVKRVVKEVNNGQIQQTINVTTQNSGLEELKTLFNEMLATIAKNVATDTVKLQAALVSYQKLDFTHRIPDASGNVAKGLNSLAEIINQMLVDNKTNGLTLEQSSYTLLQNVDILNTNSNQAAASLEETAAALEEMTGSIKSNTSNVIQMANNANQLNKSASEGQSLATETTKAMDDINDEVAAISESIGVIDQIAFQTNILSLNAAVEAATAGEAGKGFAVVAQEVRNLAARSAEAANEIKALVENATSKANNGKVIADKMIQGYTSLNDNISQTIELINSVETSSKEQQSGIVQINDAVASLDKQTQENASVASQTQNVATQTDEIAKLIVNDANEKDFIGKNDLKAKVQTNKNITPIKQTTPVPKAVQKEKIVPKPETNQNLKAPTQDIKAITSQNDDEDEWASF